MVDVRLDGVRKEYGAATALDGVDIAVEDGEFFTLVGPSGCGKTTTLRLVAGFEAPTAGRVAFGDAEMTGVPPEERGVGVVFQNYALFPHMSVAENVGYGLRFSPPPDGASRAERVAELLSLVDLDGLGDRDPEALSGGQRQRVALARALAPGPRLLLLDEPMSALDAQLRERLRLQVKEIQSELGITALYVTHDQEEALAVSDRVAVMNDGQIEQVGTPREVYRRPRSQFVASFVGDNNVFEGEVIESAAGRAGGRDATGGTAGGDGEESVVETADGDGEPAFARSDGTETGGLRVAVGGETFRLDGVDRAVGEPVSFCVRPERLRVGAGENRFRARVESREFLGETTRVHLDWDGRSVTLRTTDPPADAVTLGFDPGDAHVLPK